MDNRIKHLLAACWLSLGWITLAQADVTPTAKDFSGEGKNRATIQMDRQMYASRMEVGFLMNTLAKRSGDLKLPAEPSHLYQQVDPVPLRSEKVFTPWLDHFKQAVVFVIGYLDPKRFKISQWSVSLHDENGVEVKSFSGTGQPPRAFYWNGQDREYNPVEVGKGYVPEIVLVDYYGAKAVLPQEKLILDQFIWQSSNLLRAGFMQESVFQPKRMAFSEDGELIMRELSSLVSQHSALLVDIECLGPDLELSQERAEALQKYFARENLRLKKIRVKKVAVSGEAVVYINAIKVHDQ